MDYWFGFSLRWVGVETLGSDWILIYSGWFYWTQWD